MQRWSPTPLTGTIQPFGYAGTSAIAADTKTWAKAGSSPAHGWSEAEPGNHRPGFACDHWGVPIGLRSAPTAVSRSRAHEDVVARRSHGCGAGLRIDGGSGAGGRSDRAPAAQHGGAPAGEDRIVPAHHG